MSQWAMNQNGNVLPIQTLRKLRDDEVSCPLNTKEREDFDSSIQKRHGTSISPPDPSLPIEVEPAYDETGDASQSIPDADDLPDYDKYVYDDVLLNIVVLLSLS